MDQRKYLDHHVRHYWYYTGAVEAGLIKKC